MTDKKFNKSEFERQMKKEYLKNDIMIKGKRVDFETKIKNFPLSVLMYGDKPQDNLYIRTWENFKRYN